MPPASVVPPEAAASPDARRPAPAASETREERFAALKKEYDDAMHVYEEAFEAALAGIENPSFEDFQKAQVAAKAPDWNAFAARAKAVLDEDGTDLAAYRVLAWLLGNERDATKRSAVVAMLKEHHMQRKELGELCQLLNSTDPAFVAQIAKDSPHRDVRGRALIAQAEGLSQDIETAENLRGLPEKEIEEYRSWLGAERFAALKELDRDATERQSQKLYERVVKEYGDVPVNQGTKRETTLGKQAAAALRSMIDLVVGKPAPEIEGVDLDKVPFKLSDYRGKVVLLDFWGNW